MRESFSRDSPMFLPTFFSLRTLEKSFLHILLVGEDGNVAYSSDNVTRNICTYEFEKFKIEHGSNRPNQILLTLYLQILLLAI